MICKNPNLPASKVTTVAISAEYTDVHRRLGVLGVEVIPVEREERLCGPLAVHADMQLFHLSDSDWIVSDIHSKTTEKLGKIGLACHPTGKKIAKDYPQDVVLNSAQIGNYLICNEKYVDPGILKHCHAHHIEIIPVKQGYAKCSVAICSREAIITSDQGIAKAVFGKLDCLLIQPGFIELPGYRHGFIGGCTGMLNKDILGISGTLSFHPDKNRIINFLTQHSIYIEELSGDPLEDIGGILPIREEG